MTMQGFITDNDLTQADQEFPGIVRLWSMLRVKPRTFLELVALYDGWSDSPASVRRFELSDEVSR